MVVGPHACTADPQLPSLPSPVSAENIRLPVPSPRKDQNAKKWKIPTECVLLLHHCSWKTVSRGPPVVCWDRHSKRLWSRWLKWRLYFLKVLKGGVWDQSVSRLVLSAALFLGLLWPSSPLAFTWPFPRACLYHISCKDIGTTGSGPDPMTLLSLVASKGSIAKWSGLGLQHMIWGWGAQINP